MSMIRPPEASVAFVTLSSTPSSPLKKKLFLTNYEDELITAVVGFLLTGMLLAYLCLCCHVWGLHIRLLQLIKSLRSSDDTNQRNGSRGQEGRSSASVPMAGTSLEDYLTPPPRYSQVTESLPTYSCAIIRMLGHLRGPVGLRILVYVDPDIGNGSAFSDTTLGSSRADLDLRPSVSATLNSEHVSSPVAASEISAASNSSPRPNAINANNAVENNSHLSDTSNSLYSIQSETYGIEGATDYGSNCNLSVVSTITHSSTENSVTTIASAPPNDSGNLPEPFTATNVASPIQDNTNSSLNTTSSTSVDVNNNTRCGLNVSCAHSSTSAPSLSFPSTTLEGNSKHTCNNINSCACQEGKQKSGTNSEAVNGTIIFSTETGDRLGTRESPYQSTSAEASSPRNSIQLLMKGVGGMDQVVYALRSTHNCYVAHWPLPSNLDSDYLEVVVHGQPVEDIFLEFLNGEGEPVAMTKLLPSPGSSTLSSRNTSNTNVFPLSPSLRPPLSPDMPPPYHP